MFDAETGRQLAFARLITDHVTAYYLCDVVVDPAFRGQGLAERTVRRLIADARSMGCRRMVLDTFPFLAGAICLYKKLGFREIESYNGAPMPDLIYLGLDLAEED